MQLKLLKSKLHLATVTGARLDYHGSLTIDPVLMESVGILPYEAILVSNLATGQRAETYAIPGEPGGGQIELNGAMARIGSVDDRIIVMAFALLDSHEIEGHRPRVVALDDRNRIAEHVPYDPVRLPGTGEELSLGTAGREST